MRALLLLSYTMIVFSAWSKQVEYSHQEFSHEERLAGWFCDNNMDCVSGAAMPHLFDDPEDEGQQDIAEDTDINEW